MRRFRVISRTYVDHQALRGWYQERLVPNRHTQIRR